MAEYWTLKDAFGYFGATMTNPRWSWSARNKNDGVVVVTWWLDEVGHRNGKLVYDSRHHPRLALWRGRHGNRDRIKNMVYARDHCGGLFRVVWARARDPEERIRQTVERYPDKTLRMRLIELNEQTGEFLAEEVEHA